MKLLLDFSPPLELSPWYTKEMKCRDSWVLFSALIELYSTLQNVLDLGGRHCSQVPKENDFFKISRNNHHSQ